MATPVPTSGQPLAPKEKDFVQKHGKRIVVIFFSILIGDALPTIIQNGLDPDKLFYTIVLMTLPYTGALVLVFIALIKSGENFYAKFMGSGIILLAGFWLGAYFHWGISDVEYARVMEHMKQINHVPYGAAKKPQHHVIFNDMIVLFQFYIDKYGLPLFISATLASFVITWNILKWMD